MTQIPERYFVASLAAMFADLASVQLLIARRELEMAFIPLDGIILLLIMLIGMAFYESRLAWHT